MIHFCFHSLLPVWACKVAIVRVAIKMSMYVFISAYKFLIVSVQFLQFRITPRGDAARINPDKSG